MFMAERRLHMEHFEIRPLGTPETEEGSEISDLQILDDATFEPLAYVEQSGDYKQSEAIQGSFIAVSNNATVTTEEEAVETQVDSAIPVSMTDTESDSDQILTSPRVLAATDSDGAASTLFTQRTLSSGQAVDNVDVDILQTIQPETTVLNVTAATLAVPPAETNGSEVLPSSVELVKKDAVDSITATRAEMPDGKMTVGELEPQPLPAQSAMAGGGLESGRNALNAIPINQEAHIGNAEREPSEGSRRGVLISDLSSQKVESVGSLTTPEIDLTETVPENITATSEELGPTGEGNDAWTPPEMYVYADSNGKLIVVDKNGNPVDSPPVVIMLTDKGGNVIYVAHYPGMESDQSFEISSYTSSLEGMSVGYDEDGNMAVFDEKGQPVESPPLITKGIGPDGQEIYYAYYPGSGADSGVELGAYSTSLENCYANVGQDGKVTIVDADGNPLSCQPIIMKYIDEKGMEHISVYYPGSGVSSKVDVPGYSTSLDGCYANVGQDGTVTIVDADGNPLNSQPIITKYVDARGQEHISAYYSGSGSGSSIDMPGYSASLEGCYVSVGQDGKVVIVDADGNPLSSQPIITKLVDYKGVEHFSVYYSGSGVGSSVDVPGYSASLAGCYAAADQNGKIIIVDENGKPLSCQPFINKYVDAKGEEHISAWYLGDLNGVKTTLGWYIPASGSTGN
jgi:hypothetical protein